VAVLFTNGFPASDCSVSSFKKTNVSATPRDPVAKLRVQAEFRRLEERPKGGASVLFLVGCRRGTRIEIQGERERQQRMFFHEHDLGKLKATASTDSFETAVSRYSTRFRNSDT